MKAEGKFCSQVRYGLHCWQQLLLPHRRIPTALRDGVQKCLVIIITLFRVKGRKGSVWHGVSGWRAGEIRWLIHDMIYLPIIYCTINKIKIHYVSGENMCFTTVCTDKGAQGTWCVMHGTWCTTGAMTCDEVSKVHKGGATRPQNYYI